MIHDLKQDMPEIVHKAVTDAWDAHGGVNEAALEEIFARNFERYFGSQQAKLAKPLRQGESPLEYAPVTSPISVEMLQTSVAHLKCWCQLEILEQWSDARGSIAVHPEIAIALDHWWNDQQSVCLWIQGMPDDGASPSLIGEMFAMARVAKISVAAYFCQRINPAGTASAQEELATSLLHSLIYQMVQNLPKDFSDAIDFDPESITKLDGTAASLAPAMSLFRHLLAIGSSPALILVGNFDLLDLGDDVELQGQIKFLLEILKSPIQIPGKVNKTLLWTSEPSTTLLTEIEPQNVVDASQLSGSEGFFAFNY